MSGEFIGNLLHASTIAHVYHLRTKSFAEHMALGDFYEGIAEATDKLAEALIGGYGDLEGYPETYEMPGGEAARWLEMLSRYVGEQRKELPQDSCIQNIVDEIEGLIDSTQYKLRLS